VENLEISKISNFEMSSKRKEIFYGIEWVSSQKVLELTRSYRIDLEK
jgi:hypothetical protein